MSEKPELTKEEKAKQASKFAMTEADDLAADLAEEEEHVHVHGCCSCHSNVGH
jgi:hypothetical protein